MPAPVGLLVLAAWEGDYDALAARIAAGDDVCTELCGCGCRATALHLSCLRMRSPSAAGRHVDCVALLLQHGASVDALCKDGRTPLHWAAGITTDNAIACATLLIDAGADVEARDHSGKTPAQMATTLSVATHIQTMGAQSARWGLAARSCLRRLVITCAVSSVVVSVVAEVAVTKSE